MDYFEHLLTYFNKSKEETESQPPEGVCPVCWGYQEYDHKIRKLFEDDQIDVLHHQKKYTLVRKFVKDHIDGIRLKKGEIEVCPTCGREYDKKELNVPREKIALKIKHLLKSLFII